MATLKKSVTFSSVALMTGKECTATIEPSEEKGIRYHFEDGVVEGKIENVVSTDHCVVFGNRQVKKIILTEHFSAACAICGIDSLDVYLTHYELPIGDGSSKPWVDLFKKTGIKLHIIWKEPNRHTQNVSSKSNTIHVVLKGTLNIPQNREGYDRTENKS